MVMKMETAATKKKINADDLTGLEITRFIIHDIPQRDKADPNAVEPMLSEIECPMHAETIVYMRDHLKNALGSSRAHDIQFDKTSSSPVPGLVRSATNDVLKSVAFVAMSQQIAKHLFSVHTRATSAGLLVVMDCTIYGEQALAILKLSRHGATQITLIEKDGKRTFNPVVLKDLVLGEGTRLFKSALFHRIGTGEDDISALACDEQGEETSLAHFWRSFLGCMLIEKASVMTERYFNVTLEYIDTRIDDPIAKTALYEALHVELNSNKKAVVPVTFISQHVPKDHRAAFRAFLEEKHVSLKQFDKDTAHIATKLKRRQYISEKGAVVTAPVNHPEIVKVTKDQIIVADALKRVGKK